MKRNYPLNRELLLGLVIFIAVSVLAALGLLWFIHRVAL